MENSNQKANVQIHELWLPIREIVEALPDPLLVLTNDQKIVLVNAQAVSAFGYLEQEIVGQKLDLLLPERLRGIHFEHIENFLKSPVQTMSTDLELVGRKKDGCEFSVDVSLSRLEAADGIVAIAIVRPITERRQADEAMRKLNLELEQRVADRTGELERFFSVSIDMLCIAHSDGYFKRLSPAFTKSLGWSVEELTSKPFIEFVHPDDAKATLAEVERQIARGEPVLQFENRYKHLDGSWRVLSWRSVPQPGGYMYAVARDITEQKQWESALQEAKMEAERASLAKSEFLSRMSHELRTPLNSVMGYAQLLVLQQSDPKVKEAANLIFKGGQHLLKMIDEVLDFSRIESGNLAISVEPVPILETLRQAVDLVKPVGKSAGVQVNIEGETCEGLHVRADGQRLLQVLINLLSNGVKYNHSGGSVSVHCEEKSNGVVRIAVSDTARGFAKQDLELMFQPFQRFGDPGIEGTGLGLVLSERFVRLMGGTLSLFKTSPAGSTFHIDLVGVEAPYQKAESEEIIGANATVSRSGTVLCIEDNLSNMRLIEMLFSDKQHLNLIPAMQGRIGLELAREHKPDVILLDLHLPDLMGDRVLAELKADLVTRAIPVVMLSADATPKQIKALLAAGAVEYLTKPVDIRLLFAVLDQHLPNSD